MLLHQHIYPPGNSYLVRGGIISLNATGNAWRQGVKCRSKTGRRIQQDKALVFLQAESVQSYKCGQGAICNQEMKTFLNNYESR